MTKEKKEVKKVGQIDVKEFINKKTGINVAFSLNEENPSEVVDWIPTTSTWLDSIIAKGIKAGIPVGRITELAGGTGSGKSYMAAQIVAQAQKKDIKVIYFDSESSIDPEFLKKIGVDLDEFTYVQATSVEFVFKTIEQLLAATDNIRYLFVIDSFANIPSEGDIEDKAVNPQSSMARIPRIASLGLKKITLPLANANSTLLVLNQLRVNLGNPTMMKIEPFMTPGGNALIFCYSLRIWLTKKRGKEDYVVNDKNGFRVGSEVKVKLQKSRFGTEGRECLLKIIWGQDPIGVQDEESWLDAIKGSDRLKILGAWKSLVLNDGNEVKFQDSSWMEKIKDSKFKESVLSIIDEEVIQKFEKKTGKASNYYSIEGEEPDLSKEDE